MSDAWNLNSLFKCKLWVVTGKGGVGKTTLAAALGLLAARQGIKTLLVETHGLAHLGELFAVGQTGYSAKTLQQNLSLVQLTAEQCFEEYVLQQIHLRLIYDTVFKNRYVQHFIEAAPGLAELLTIGKIWSLAVDETLFKKKTYYDLVIVDAPATGHGLSLLTVPQVVQEAVRMGPLKQKAAQILELLQDSEQTLTWLCTLPEEMPVNEAIEMEAKLVRDAKIQVGPLLMNMLWPQLLSKKTETELAKLKTPSHIYRSYQAHQENATYYLGKLQEALPQRQILHLPLVYQENTPLGIARALSQNLEAQL